MKPPPTIPLILGWGACGIALIITAAVAPLSAPVCFSLAGVCGAAICGIMGWQMAYEYQA